MKKNRIGLHLASWSIVLNLFLFVIKYVVGLISGSIAIIIDAWHTLSDSFTSLIVILGFKISAKPPDDKHPFGHGRIEMIATVIVGTILAIVGFEFLNKAINNISDKSIASYNLFTIIVIIFSVVSKEVMAQICLYQGKKNKSKLLHADGWHHRTDALTSSIILIGIFFSKRFWWIDGALGIVLALVILYSAYSILKKSVSILIGEEASEGLQKEIQNSIKKYCDLEIEYHHFHIHRYGDHKEVTFHITLDPEIKLKDAHKISTKIENILFENLALETTIHIEPKSDE